MDDELIIGDVIDLDTERAYAVHRRLRVPRSAEPVDACLAFAERSDQDGAVRDRLVPGDDDVADERRSRLDAH